MYRPWQQRVTNCDAIAPPLVALVGAVAIRTRFENLTDPRVERTKRHFLIDMVTNSLNAAICGADDWGDVEKFGVAKRD